MCHVGLTDHRAWGVLSFADRLEMIVSELENLLICTRNNTFHFRVSRV